MSVTQCRNTPPWNESVSHTCMLSSPPTSLLFVIVDKKVGPCISSSPSNHTFGHYLLEKRRNDEQLQMDKLGMSCTSTSAEAAELILFLTGPWQAQLLSHLGQSFLTVSYPWGQEPLILLIGSFGLFAMMPCSIPGVSARYSLQVAQSCSWAIWRTYSTDSGLKSGRRTMDMSPMVVWSTSVSLSSCSVSCLGTVICFICISACFRIVETRSDSLPRRFWAADCVIMPVRWCWTEWTKAVHRPTPMAHATNKARNKVKANDSSFLVFGRDSLRWFCFSIVKTLYESDRPWWSALSRMSGAGAQIRHTWPILVLGVTSQNITNPSRHDDKDSSKNRRVCHHTTEPTLPV
jgi:hypothetical protein